MRHHIIKMPKTMKKPRCSYDVIGDIQRHGCYDGAISYPYMVVGFHTEEDGLEMADLVQVEAQRICHSDGTFGHVWVKVV